MSSKTVSLEKSAYDRLKASKLPGESFTDAVNRLVQGGAPSFRVLAGSLRFSDARAVKTAIRKMREAETSGERKLLDLRLPEHGRHTR